MRGSTGNRWLAMLAGLAMLGCSDATAPSEPSSTFAAYSVEASASSARHEELKKELERRKAEFKAAREASKDSVKAAREEFKAWKKDWKTQYKLEREAWKRAHPHEKGEPEIQLLRCEPQDYEGDAVIVGPNGGTVRIGDHELVIPRGALAQEELIVADAPPSSLVDVRFFPHGLQFARPAQLKLSYKDCVLPTASEFMIAYLGQGGRVLELPPSVDHQANDEVEADIDHFSRYAIAW